MVRGGRVERFCQQCSRFHAVTEFDGERRSCRTQLERHNARRRKQRALAASNSTPASSSSAAVAAAAAGASGSVSEEPPGQPPLQRQRVAMQSQVPGSATAGAAAAAAVASAMAFGMPYDVRQAGAVSPGALQSAAGSDAMHGDQILSPAAAAGGGGGAVDPGWPFASICIGGDPQMGVHGAAADNMNVNVSSSALPVDPMWPWGGPAGPNAPLAPSAEWENPLQSSIPQAAVTPAANHMPMQGEGLPGGDQEAFVDPAASMHDKHAWTSAPEDDFWRVMYDFTHTQPSRSGGGSAATVHDAATNASMSHSTEQGGYAGAGVSGNTTASQHVTMSRAGAQQVLQQGERSTGDVKSEGGPNSCCNGAAPPGRPMHARSSSEFQDGSTHRQSAHEGVACPVEDRSLHSHALSRGETNGARLQHTAAVGQASETKPESQPEKNYSTAQAEFFRLGPEQEETDEDTDRLLQQIFTKPKVARALRRVLLGTPAVDGAQGGLGKLPEGGVPKGGASAAAEGPERAHQRAVIAAAMLQLGGAEVPVGARSSLRICAKLWGCTPDTLPANLQDSVLSWVNVRCFCRAIDERAPLKFMSLVVFTGLKATSNAGL